MLPDLGKDEWVRVGMAAKDGGVPFDKWTLGALAQALTTTPQPLSVPSGKVSKTEKA